jgi:hypothetical protein
MKNHLIDITVAAEGQVALTASIAALRQELAVFAISLDPTQRKNYARLGLRNETFSRSVLDLARQKPEIVPNTIDVLALQRDVVARDLLLPLLLELKSSTQLLEDTTIALGIDIFESARGIYKSAKVTAGISGTSAIIREIGQRFAGQRRKKKSTPTTPTPTDGTGSTSGTGENNNGTVNPTL